jgi:hypothetical protein
MQPRYLTLTSTAAPSPWQLTNWHCTPQELSFQVISAGSSYNIQVTLEDPTGTYPNPNSSSPTAFTVFTGSSNAIFGLGSSATVPLTEPIAAFRFTLTALSTLGGATSVTFVSMQSGIG